MSILAIKPSNKAVYRLALFDSLNCPVILQMLCAFFFQLIKKYGHHKERYRQYSKMKKSLSVTIFNDGIFKNMRYLLKFTHHLHEYIYIKYKCELESTRNAQTSTAACF